MWFIEVTAAFVVVACGGRAGARSVPSPTAVPTAIALLPSSWIAGLHGPQDGTLLQLACLDVNADGRLDAADGADLAGVDVPLTPAACRRDARYGEYFAQTPPSAAAYSCTGAARPVHLVIIGGGGTNLLDPTVGVSLGLLDVRNELYDRLNADGIASTTVLMTPAVAGADFPQTRMEQWLRLDLVRRLTAAPCLRAVLIGHSHGAVVTTSVMAALEPAFPGRIYGVVVDRTLALYDRLAMEMPSALPLLNVYQINEGWHGTPIARPNVTNLDESEATAPLEPRVARAPLVRVTHTNLDDSADAQTRIADAVMSWLEPDHVT